MCVLRRFQNARCNDQKNTSSPKRPDVFWGPSSVLINGYWRLFPWEQCDLEVNNLVRRLRMELHLHPPCALWRADGQFCCYLDVPDFAGFR